MPFIPAYHLPFCRASQRIGLMGGSFDPAHMGHMQVARFALKRFDLHQVWWLLTPANPLKDHAPAPLTKRLAQAQSIAQHPRIRVSAIETHLGSHFTDHTLSALKRRHPNVQFIWLMGADNMVHFHHWYNWQEIAHQMPIGVFTRSAARAFALQSPFARRFAKNRLAAHNAALLPLCAPPQWCFISMPLRPESSRLMRS